jgi:hypothetical protein
VIKRENDQAMKIRFSRHEKKNDIARTDGYPIVGVLLLAVLEMTLR